MKQRGFTLIELVIVVAIVGILASGALPLARWSVKRSKEYVLQQNLRIMRNAIDRYHDAAQAGLIEVPEGTSGYPESLDVLVEGVPLLGQMPPIMPGVSGEYDATGPGLTGGLRAQTQTPAGAGSLPGVGGATMAPGGQQPQQQGLFNRGGATGSGQPGRRSPGGGLSFGVDVGNEADSQQSAAGSRFGSALGQQQGSAGAASSFDRLRQPGAVGQLDTQANEPLIGSDGKPVMLMFLRRIPIDPMTGKAEWGVRCYGEPPTDRLWCGRDVFDIYSKAFSAAIDGTKYGDW